MDRRGNTIFSGAVNKTLGQRKILPDLMHKCLFFDQNARLILIVVTLLRNMFIEVCMT